MCLFGSSDKKNLQTCLDEKSKLSADLTECESQLTQCRDETKRLQRLCEDYVSSLEAKESELVKVNQRLTDAITIPSVSPVGGVTVYPYDMTPAQWKGATPLVISDTRYLAYTEDEWVKTLSPLQSEVKRVLGFPKNDVSDCENWTNAMIFIVQETFRRGGYPLQGAFLKLLSKPHSYCGYMLPDYTIKVYEPMNGETVGVLGETGLGNFGEDTYKTEQAFFLT